MMPYGDRKQYFISRVKCLRDEPRDCGKSDPLVTFFLRQVITSEKVARCRIRERFLVVTSAHRVERLLSSWCGKTQIAPIEANRVATKKASFAMYLAALTELVPWFHALDHTHYARWIPVHLRDMAAHPLKHP